MTNIEWRATSIGPAGTLYFDMFIDDVRVQDVWIVEFDMGGVRKWSFRRGASNEQWYPMRATLAEAKADAAMYFARRELEKHR